MKHWFLLGIAICLEIIATSALTASKGFTKPLPIFFVVFGYGAAFYCLSQILNVIPVGVTYAIWSGVGIVMITLVGWLFFEQKIDLPALIGIGLITAGVIVMNVFSSSIHSS